MHLSSEKCLSRYITSDNLNKNINRFLNLNLKGGRISFENFVDRINAFYIQFEEKLENKHIDNTKTKILNFYVDKININLNKFPILSY